MTSSFWFNSHDNPNPLCNMGSNDPLTPGADVCVIGSGLTGVSAAYHLSQSEIAPYLKVVVLEDREFCSGATGRNGGFLSAASCTSIVKLQEDYGTNEALRGLLLEHHSYNFTIGMQERHDLLKEASILFGDSIQAEDEYFSNKADYNGAKAGGMDVTGINCRSSGAYTDPFAAAWPQKIATQLYLLAERHFYLSLHIHTPVLSVNTPVVTPGHWLCLADPWNASLAMPSFLNPFEDMRDHKKIWGLVKRNYSIRGLGVNIFGMISHPGTEIVIGSELSRGHSEGSVLSWRTSEYENNVTPSSTASPELSIGENRTRVVSLFLKVER
ncbi:DAO-domain-containing protein [Guyanagaster necrorhizus]|uniref:DAO-domain-containing protein n=1 Tax=Guyanagaster necrorhizus TaxID=856835 RepID=A0A9P7VI94_9AGAR|nr:DAO-domain-containing protein [Guyanagaster necrorhizus MCA 3950]KAG7440531.1 DAO-domain-containing protein [Guyanagaster necrorhizus MCA 3950]